jgi:hypothetical protein
VSFFVFNGLITLRSYSLNMQIGPQQHAGCPYLTQLRKAQEHQSAGRETPGPTDTVEFGPSMPIIDGEVRIPTAATVAKNTFVPHDSYELPPVKRSDLGLSAVGPKGEFVAPGNQWPNETIHPLFPEFKQLSGVDKMASISHYAHASRRTGKLDPLGQYGITKNPQLIVDPIGMRWPFEAAAQTAAARPREKNMHGRGSWGAIEIVPNPDPAKRLANGVLNKGGLGDLRLSLGAEQDTNVVGGALGIPLSPNDQGVESANFLMLSGPGPQLDNLDFFAKPLSTVALPNEDTPLQFKVLDHAFKASAESGVRPGNHMFRYDQDGGYNPAAEIPAEVHLAPNPKMSLHRLAPLETQSVDGVEGKAVTEEFQNLNVQHQGKNLPVLDLALSEALVKSTPDLKVGGKLSLSIADAEGKALSVQAKVAEQTENGTRVEFVNPSDEARMAIYQSLDLIYEIGRRIKPGDDLYTVNVKTEDGQWKQDVARVKAKSEFFPNKFADHQRLYGHTERPDSTPVLRKILSGIRWATGNIAEALSLASF